MSFLKKLSSLLIILSTLSFISTAEENKLNDDSKIHFNPWELLIYRPENSGNMNNIRCYLKIEDMEGNDVTFTKAKATYYYANNVVRDPKAHTRQFGSIFHHDGPRTVFNYKKKYFLEGGLVMYLLLEKGKYKISVSTPEKGWTSNIFEYDTENPAKVIFVSPTANENGFYNGGWYIDYKAPSYYKFTKPKITEQ